MESGIKETKDALVGALEVTVVIINRFKDGIQLGDDISAILEKWKNDKEFKARLKEAIDGAAKIPEEVKDLNLSEGFELMGVLIGYGPKIIGAFKK